MATFDALQFQNSPRSLFVLWPKKATAPVVLVVRKNTQRAIIGDEGRCDERWPRWLSSCCAGPLQPSHRSQRLCECSSGGVWEWSPLTSSSTSSAALLPLHAPQPSHSNRRRSCSLVLGWNLAPPPPIHDTAVADGDGCCSLFRSCLSKLSAAHRSDLNRGADKTWLKTLRLRLWDCSITIWTTGKSRCSFSLPRSLFPLTVSLLV